MANRSSCSIGTNSCCQDQQNNSVKQNNSVEQNNSVKQNNIVKHNNSVKMYLYFVYFKRFYVSFQWSPISYPEAVTDPVRTVRKCWLWVRDWMSEAHASPTQDNNSLIMMRAQHLQRRLFCFSNEILSRFPIKWCFVFVWFYNSHSTEYLSIPFYF